MIFSGLFLRGTLSAQVSHGGMGNFFVGPAYSITSSLEDDLNASGQFEGTVQLNKTTFLFGGGGYSALKYFIMDKELKENSKRGCAIIGLDAGASFFPATDNWKGSSEIITMENPFAMLFYLRITVGWGSFYDLQK